MDADEVQSILEQRRQDFEECTTEDALNAPVDAERFYRFIASIDNIHTHGSGHLPNDKITVAFNEPVPGATTLDSGYTYKVSVGRESTASNPVRMKMPKEELLALQQTAIIIWSIVTGHIFKPAKSTE